MFRHRLIASLVGAALALTLAPGGAQQQTQAQERIYGSQLMTQRERNEYRGRLRTAKTAEEREQIRAEHHEAMKVRAKERGVSLPDQPPDQPGHMGRGQGAGPGGGGMGPGGGGMGPSGGGMGPGGGRP